MSILSLAIESVAVIDAEASLDVTHIVCHCMDTNVAFCGADTSDLEWVDAEDWCPMCEAMWESDLPCPGGCGCEECS